MGQGLRLRLFLCSKEKTRTEARMQWAGPQAKTEGMSAFSVFSEAGPLLQDPLGLAEMVARMRTAHQTMGVTGAIACDEGRLLHWIEGPEAAVGLLWDRIRVDPRHRVKWANPPEVVTARHFPGSPLRLAMTVANLATLHALSLDDIFGLPERANSSGLTPEAHLRLHPPPEGGPDCAGLFAEIQEWRLDAVHRAQTNGALEARTKAIVAVLNGPDPKVARSQLEQLLWQTGVLETAALVQGIHDALQAGWMTGRFSALQQQLAMAMLQSAVRRRMDIEESTLTIGSALVSLLPGTTDMCGVMVKVALLRRAGWSVRLLLPARISEIVVAAEEVEPDVIVLAGSQLASRTTDLDLLADLLPMLSETLAAPVIVSGKLAETDPKRVMALGASGVCASLTWIAPIAAHLAEEPPIDLRQTRNHKTTGQVLRADRALASLLADSPPGRGRQGFAGSPSA
jgi:hypothetical protein